MVNPVLAVFYRIKDEAKIRRIESDYESLPAGRVMKISQEKRLLEWLQSGKERGGRV